TCVELGKKQGKQVIVVKDGVGFYTSRVLAPMMNEAAHLVAEGVPIEKIDTAMLNWGFPVGPIKLTDEVGIDVGAKVGKIMLDAFGDRMSPPDGMQNLIDDERYGRKNGRGFYLYGDKKKKGVDESVYEVLGVTPNNKSITSEDIAWRCALQFVNEACRCFGEGILRSARDGDVGAIFGLGFPPFRGGPFRFIDQVGAKEVLGRLRELEKQHGPRFSPAPVLEEIARSGQTFHGEDATQPGQSRGNRGRLRRRPDLSMMGVGRGGRNNGRMRGVGRLSPSGHDHAPNMAPEARAKKLESAARTIAESRRPRHRNVLLVENDPDLQWSLARMLTVDGNRVVGTSSGDGALTVIEQWDADLALVASNLPGTSGIEVARQLREWNPDLLVILMGEETPGSSAKERSSYVTASLAKPFRFEALRALIESIQLTPAPAE
ncbi:MAG: response regulator, partial [Deltaproteobacteria bacterium]|nr:response regulator [Deltaproteobacteria bacterium]